LSTSLALAAAQAGEDPYAPYAAEQTIEIRAEPGVHTSLLEGGRTVRSCDGDCVMRVRAGSYRVRAEGDFPTRTIRLGAGRDVRLEVEPGDSTVKWGGLATGIVGSTTVLVGLVSLMVVSICFDSCPSDRYNAPLLVTGVGAALATVGWVGFGLGGTHIEVGAPDGGQRRGPGAFAFGVVPTRGGAYGAIGLTF
jgi:hypothetical protein